MKSLAERAATALDLTLDHDGRGPVTFLARRRVAEALDLGRAPRLADLVWLELVSRESTHLST